jgi:hypothetical protein
MEASVKRARAAVQALGRRGLRQRIPEAVRAEVLRYVDAARAQRRPWAEIAATLGLSKSALTRWRRSARRSPAAALRPVRVREERPCASPERGLVWITPSGHRLEGLGREDAVALVRALG